jgi:hypothetical protein
LKAKRSRPWPPKVFLDSLNSALGQGFVHRASGSGPISSLQHDGATELTIRGAAPKPPEPPPVQTPAGRRGSILAVLSMSEIQDLADQIHTLSKPLAGMDPQIEVRITVKTKGDGDLSLANSILDKLKAGWKLRTCSRCMASTSTTTKTGSPRMCCSCCRNSVQPSCQRFCNDAARP